MRDICEILGVNRSSFYYQPKADPSEAVLLAEIEKLAGAYPRYGYRRITQLLVRQGYTVGTRRVARLMKEMNLWVSVKRACQTTRSLQGDKPWPNLLETLDVSHRDQVWVADITSVRLKDRFIYLCLLMDVFTRVIKAWRTSGAALEPISDTQTAQRGIRFPRCPGDSPFRSRRAVSCKRLYRNTPSTRCSDFRGTPRPALGERICGTPHTHAQGGRSLSQ